jgi:8-oxo-dGTP pyrophosphatase MutT (NUDIX family)
MSRELFEIRMGAYIFNENNEFLLLQNKEGTWGICGGHMEKNEQIIETVHREVKEEVGIEVDVIDQFDMFVIKDGSFVVSFACKYKSGEVKILEEEINDYKWVKIKELNDFNLTFEALPNMVQKAQEIIKSKN